MVFNEQALERFCASVQSDIDKDDILGAAVIIAQGGKIGLRKNFGTVTKNGRTASFDDIYLAMSLTKSFTAALVHRAVENGQFTLSTKVSELIPEFAAGGKQNITVYQCLTHTAGLFAGFIPPKLSIRDSYDLEKVVKAIGELPAAYSPGTQCAYTPIAGFAVVAQLIVVTDPQKRPFTQIAHEELFEPLGMGNTSFGLDENHPRRVEICHTKKRSNPKSTELATTFHLCTQEGSVWPGGSAWTTLDDVFRFAEMMRLKGNTGKYRVFSPASFEYGSKNHTGDMINHAWDHDNAANGNGPLPAHFTLLGGYTRGEGHHLTVGVTASPRAFYAVGGGSTCWLVDPDRDFTFCFLSAGWIDGLDHFRRLSRLADLALAALD